ncbi:hypothetical protein NHG32_01395 [Aerococcaceae bacterium NML191219]|nr:hypothetical protein [Aerococcaceae bacterium NML191219]
MTAAVFGVNHFVLLPLTTVSGMNHFVFLPLTTVSGFPHLSSFRISC